MRFKIRNLKNKKKIKISLDKFFGCKYHFRHGQTGRKGKPSNIAKESTKACA
jgi:hypothetical protein